MRSRQFLSFLLIAACVSLPMLGAAQVYESTSKQVLVNFLLRVQREERVAATCAIVYPDHKVHFEIMTGGGTRVLEGQLNDAAVTQLNGLLPAVRSIDPAAIRHKQQIEEIDIVAVNVLTERGLHNLQFSDSDTRKPFKPAMDPLLKWLGSVPKSHLNELPEKSRNNCMPTAPEGVAATPPPMNPRAAQALAQRLLLRFNVFRNDQGVTEDRCISVAPNGNYRYEVRLTADRNAHSNDKVFTGTVDSDEVSELQKLLNSDAMRASTHNPDPPNGVQALNMEVVNLFIPRPDRVQELRFFTSTGSPGYMGIEGVIATKDYDGKLLDPLRGWLRDNIERRKGVAPASDATPNGCRLF